LICSFMTLEHVSDPGVLVGDAHTLLESGGMVAVVVHDWRAPLNRLLGLKSPIIDVEHLQLFSPSSLRRLLESRGFRDVEVRSITNSYALRYWVRLTPLPVGLKNTIIRLLECLRIADLHLPFRVGNMLGTGFKA
ncbi:MAG: class I SAM-dependent methyltransferase, partial [Alphaproteobacteria bacterium]|nr:class I SAM-dependent methyltransferase [Alphaproteobacteria bacterium]